MCRNIITKGNKGQYNIWISYQHCCPHSIEYMKYIVQQWIYCDNLGTLIKRHTTQDTSCDRVIQILSNGPSNVLFYYLLFWNIPHHKKAVYKCTISWCVQVVNMVLMGYLCKYSQQTGIASQYSQCYNLISYSGHARGSEKDRYAKMCVCVCVVGGGGGGARKPYLASGLICVILYMSVEKRISITKEITNNSCTSF